MKIESLRVETIVIYNLDHEDYLAIIRHTRETSLGIVL